MTYDSNRHTSNEVKDVLKVKTKEAFLKILLLLQYLGANRVHNAINMPIF